MASPAESFFAPIREAAARAGLADFLRWWVSEIAAMVPVRWRERLSSGSAAFVGVDAGEWRAMRPGDGSLVEVGRMSADALEGPGRRAAFIRLVQQATGGAANVWLLLPDESVLTRKAVLPLAAEEALRDAIGFELDRLTPFSAEQALFDCRVTERDVPGQRLTVELAVAARGPVEAQLEQLRDLGATLLGVGVPRDVATAPVPFNLLAPELRERAATSDAAIVARVLAALAAVLAVAALIYPLWQKWEAAIELLPRLEKAKSGAAESDRLAAEIERLAAEHNFLLSRKQSQYPAVVLLEDLSRLLPDATWVQQLDIKNSPKVREIQIAGETGSSSQLIEVLEKSGSLANASFKSPLTKGVTPNTDRFLVSAEVKLRPLPQPLPESALLSPAPSDAPSAPPKAMPAAVVSPAAPGAPTAVAAPPVPAAAAPAAATPVPPPATLPDAPAVAPAGPKPAAVPAVKAPNAAIPAKPAPKG